MVDKILFEKITAIDRDSPKIISICGAADLGKSYIADRTARLLNSKGISANHLPLDAFLVDRNIRKMKGWSGYQIESHCIDQAMLTLRKWKEGHVVEYQEYDHEAGEKSKTYKKLMSSEFLIAEGLFAMHESLIPYIDYSIFIYTAVDYLKQLKLEADLVKRNYSAAYSERIYDHEYELYKNNIDPYMESADCKLYLEKKWSYIFEEKN